MATAGTRVSLKRRLPDLGLVLATWVIIMWGVGSQWWTGFNAPDSQFSATLAIFGNDVHERAIDGSYYWTRLGYLAPVHGLISMVGTWTGFALWRGLLLLITLGATYWIARHLTGRALAVGLMLFVGLNTMVLSYLGNPYATGSAMSATFLLLALGVCWLVESSNAPAAASAPARLRAWLLPLATGAVVGWLVMLNPYNALLATCLWLGIRLIAWSAKRTSVGSLARELGILLLGFIVVLIGFLTAGRVMFPSLNWFETYRSWNARLDYASFISDPHIWTRDVAFLVLLLSVVTSGFVLIFVRNRWTFSALAVAFINIAFTLIYMQIVPGPWIEAPHYAAMCWPGALVSIVLALSALLGKQPVALIGWIMIVPLVALMVWAGHSDRVFPMSTGLSIVLLVSAVLLVTIMLCATRGELIGWLAITTALIVLGLSCQFLQNGRGNLGIYGQYPMNAAFVNYNAEDLMRSNVAAQEFVLAHTTPTDRIATWTDPDRLGAAIAAMQLWGKYNNAPEGPALSAEGVRILQDLHPTALALYAPHREQIDEFYASIPLYLGPAPLECTAVPYLGIGSPTATVCVTHLQAL